MNPMAQKRPRQKSQVRKNQSTKTCELTAFSFELPRVEQREATLPGEKLVNGVRFGCGKRCRGSNQNRRKDFHGDEIEYRIVFL